MFGIALGVAGVVIAFIFLFVPNWFHEQGHIVEARKQGINLEYRFYGFRNLFERVPVGEAIPSSSEDCEKFNSLSELDRQKITHAGVLPAIVVFTIMYGLSILLLRSKKIPRWYWFIIFFIYLLAVLLTIWGNVLSPNPLNDWNRVFIPDCPSFG